MLFKLYTVVGGWVRATQASASEKYESDARTQAEGGEGNRPTAPDQSH
jgi:hypothetical protein